MYLECARSIEREGHLPDANGVVRIEPERCGPGEDLAGRYGRLDMTGLPLSTITSTLNVVLCPARSSAITFTICIRQWPC